MAVMCDEFLRITEIDLQSEYEQDTRFHTSLKADVTLENSDRHRVERLVKGYIPLCNRRSGKITDIGEAMTEYTLDGERLATV